MKRSDRLVVSGSRLDYDFFTFLMISQWNTSVTQVTSLYLFWLWIYNHWKLLLSFFGLVFVLMCGQKILKFCWILDIIKLYLRFLLFFLVNWFSFWGSYNIFSFWQLITLKTLPSYQKNSVAGKFLWKKKFHFVKSKPWNFYMNKCCTHKKNEACAIFVWH